MRPFLFVLTIWLWSSAAFEGTWLGSDASVFEPSPVVLADGGTSYPPPPNP
jgi:hypothetical protein